MSTLDEALIKKIVQAILQIKEPEKILLFGSRATGKFRKNSDIDIAIFAKDWDAKDVALTADALDENVATPLKFDVIDFYRTKNERIREKILKEGKAIYEHRTR